MNEFGCLLADFLTMEDEMLWIVDDRVWSDGGMDSFRATMDESSPADFLATAVRKHADDPDWNWWKDLKAPDGQCPLETGVAALLPLIRLSRAAAEVIVRGIADGWTGHPEAVLPTLVNRAGLKIEDIGGTGSFSPPERIGRCYDRRTWHWKGPVEHVPGMLHFPVPRQSTPLAKGRLNRREWKLKILYASPVGGAAAGLLPAVMDAFGSVDRWLIQFDDADLEASKGRGVRLIKDKGYKWQLAIQHLHPDFVADYDFIFFWDDDLDVTDFDPLRFARIMRANRLDMAQPAIRSPHGLSHAITRHRPCPPPLRDPDGVTVRSVAGRLTNFVEIMAPVFTRVAWSEFYSYLDPENRSGWGYDYIPLGRKGIVDIMPVVHTRAVQSINRESEAEIRRFLDSQGLLRHAPVEQGWLFE